MMLEPDAKRAARQNSVTNRAKFYGARVNQLVGRRAAGFAVGDRTTIIDFAVAMLYRGLAPGHHFDDVAADVLAGLSNIEAVAHRVVNDATIGPIYLAAENPEAAGAGAAAQP